MPPTYPRRPTCQRWLTAEKSPTVKTRTIVRVMRRDEGVPPYRRLRRESDTLSFRALVEKSPAVETARNIYAPAYPPAAARRREIPYGRNENNRTRIPPILARAGSAPGGGSPPRHTSDYTKNRSELLFGSVLLTFIRFWFSVRSLSDFADNSGLRSAVTLRRDRLL